MPINVPNSDHTIVWSHRWSFNAGRKWRGNRGPTASINFVTAHDGFTLADLVRASMRHKALAKLDANLSVNSC